MSKTSMTAEEEKQRMTAAIAWFVTLTHARLVDDFQRAAAAKGELERLGVVVKFRRCNYSIPEVPA